MDTPGLVDARTNTYFVDGIAHCRYSPSNERLFFFVKWYGYDKKDWTWEPIENLTDSLEAVEEYFKDTKNPNKSKFLEQYLKEKTSLCSKKGRGRPRLQPWQKMPPKMKKHGKPGRPIVKAKQSRTPPPNLKTPYPLQTPKRSDSERNKRPKNNRDDDTPAPPKLALRRKLFADKSENTAAAEHKNDESGFREIMDMDIPHLLDGIDMEEDILFPLLGRDEVQSGSDYTNREMDSTSSTTIGESMQCFQRKRKYEFDEVKDVEHVKLFGQTFRCLPAKTFVGGGVPNKIKVELGLPNSETKGYLTQWSENDDLCFIFDVVGKKYFPKTLQRFLNKMQ